MTVHHPSCEGFTQMVWALSWSGRTTLTVTRTPGSASWSLWMTSLGFSETCRRQFDVAESSSRCLAIHLSVKRSPPRGGVNFG